MDIDIDVAMRFRQARFDFATLRFGCKPNKEVKTLWLQTKRII
jgi:hypothetical protein